MGDFDRLVTGGVDERAPGSDACARRVAGTHVDARSCPPVRVTTPMPTFREAFAEGARQVGFRPHEPAGWQPPLPPGVELWRSTYAVALLWPAASDVEGLEHDEDAGLGVLVNILAAWERTAPYCRLDAYLVLWGTWSEDLALVRLRIESRVDVARRCTVSDVADLQRLTFFPLPIPPRDGQSAKHNPRSTRRADTEATLGKPPSGSTPTRSGAVGGQLDVAATTKAWREFCAERKARVAPSPGVD